MKDLKCSKFSTGIKCGYCPFRSFCLYLNPPERPPKIYRPPKQKRKFQPIPVPIAKYRYRKCLLIGEDFQLTNPEIKDLVNYVSKFEMCSYVGGRGNSWERVFAVLCIVLLERDDRPIYRNNSTPYNRRYNLYKGDYINIYNWVKEEVERINFASFSGIWGEYEKTKRLRTSGSQGEQLAIHTVDSGSFRVGTPQSFGNL